MALSHKVPVTNQFCLGDVWGYQKVRKGVFELYPDKRLGIVLADVVLPVLTQNDFKVFTCLQ
jgi:hypothetical protein